MQIPQTLVSNYTKSINGLTKVARANLERALSKFEFSGDIEGDRERLIAIMDAAIRPYVGTVSSSTGAVYDAVRRMQVGKPLGYRPTTDEAWDSAKTSEAVRAFMQKAVDGEPEKVLSMMSQRIDYEMKLAAASCMKAMGRNDTRTVRWGRVPGSDEACEFCLMLASQGFVYRTEDSADTHIHSGCNCRVMPSFGNADYEGYDPAEYKERFEQSVRARVDEWNANHPDDQRTYSQVYEKAYGTAARSRRAGNRRHR